MPLEVLNTAASLLTVLVIAATAVAAVVQLRHFRATNQLAALFSLEREFNSPDLQESFRYIQRELEYKLRDPGYRHDLTRIGFIDSRVHLEMNVCNWFNAIGAALKHDLVDEMAFMDLFSRLAVQYWEILTPAIALVRRRRGNAQYHNFEFLAIRARRWLAQHPDGEFPQGVGRIPIVDPWLAEDEPEG